MEKKETPKRKTLLQLQSETTVRDPAAHSKHQITELDKTAQRSVAKRKACADQIEADKKELAHVEEQIQSIKLRYDALCHHLEDSKEKRALVIQTLESCKLEERTIMNTTQSIVHTRRMDDAKLGREIASSILQQDRGFGVGPDTTFHQTRKGDQNTLPTIKTKFSS